MPTLTPTNIVSFMSTHIVKTDATTSSADIPYADRNRGLAWVRLDLSETSTVANEPDGKVYFLSFVPANEAATDPEAFLIYWVEYEANGPGKAIWLGDDAPLMFTALMSGCSFGLGSYTAQGVRAAHVNSMAQSLSGTPDAAQDLDQRNKLAALQANTKVIEMSTYGPGAFDPSLRTTPFGYRPQLSGGKVPMRGAAGGVGHVPSVGGLPWKFCWLKYKGQGRSVVHQGVANHAGGVF